MSIENKLKVGILALAIFLPLFFAGHILLFSENSLLHIESNSYSRPFFEQIILVVVATVELSLTMVLVNYLGKRFGIITK